MLKSDRWIRKMAHEHGMINPFSEKQVREGVVSYGLSSYGYDLRVAAEFKIFTNVNCATVDPKGFDERSFVTVRVGLRAYSPKYFCSSAVGGIFQDSPRRVDHLRWQVQVRALRHYRRRDAIRAGVGRLCDSRDFEHNAVTSEDLRQRRSLPDYLFPVRRSLRNQLRS